MCSYGGKIHPRPHDNQLTYVGGDTKILAVDRNVKFSGIMSKLSSLCDAEVFFKYQLPGEDLDALISVTNDEDLEHMMLEYDRLYRASAKPARLRLFLFPMNPPAPTSFDSSSPKSERQWFVDALNSVQIQSLESSSPPAPKSDSATNPDFLFGFDKGAPPVPATKPQDPVPAPMVPEVVQKDPPVGSDSGLEDRSLVGDPVLSSVEIQRQIQELQRLQIANNEQQAILQRRNDESNPRGYSGEYYTQKIPEKAAQAPPPAYWQERPLMAGGYQVAGTEQPVYLIQTPTGVYQAPPIRPVTGQVGQPYYGMQSGMQRVVPDVYREQPMYNGIPPPSLQQPQPKYGGYSDGIGIARPPTGGVEPGYAHVGYDGAGRQVYYTNTPGGVVPQYQTMAPSASAVDVRHQEGKVVPKTSASSM